MGIRVVPPEHGDDCAACWSANLTPKFIWVCFLDIVKGNNPACEDPPNGHWFKCEQDAVDACLFTYGDGVSGWFVQTYRSAVTGNWHITLDYEGSDFFTGFISTCPDIDDVWTNLLNNPAVFCGNGGYGYLFWMDAVVDLIDDLELPNDGNTFVEAHVKNGTTLVYKFCNIGFNMNVKVELP